MVEGKKTGMETVERMMKTIQRFNELGMEAFRGAVASGLAAWNRLPCPCAPRAEGRPHQVTSDARIICPPQDNCPPRCLATVVRHANPGEVIAVPFKVRNTGSVPRLYHLGVRPFVNANGAVIAQPSLDKIKIEVLPGAAVAAEMRVGLNKEFLPGSLYETDIVIREKIHNQNICVKLHINADAEVPAAAPYDEREIDTHFHRWYHHYYCENNGRPVIGAIDRELAANAEKES